MKYIDADKLYKEVDSQMAHYAELEEEAKPDVEIFDQGKVKMCYEILRLINSLQEEQKDILVLIKSEWKKQEQFRKNKKFGIPLQQEQPEVDFEKELKNERAKLLDAFGPMNGEQSLAIRNFARHFIELGLKARKEE